MNREEKSESMLKPLDKTSFLDTHKDMTSLDYNSIVKSTAIIIMYSAAAVATSTGLVFIPNLETISIFIFLVSFYYGFKIGFPMMFITTIIYELIASITYGFGGPLFIFKILAYSINVLVASNLGSTLFGKANIFSLKDLKPTFSKRIGFAIIGFFLTLIFDLSSTLYSLFVFQNIQAFVVFFVAGIPLMIFHEVTNGIIFYFIPDYVKLMNISSTSNYSVDR